jgi:hypothetical protein
MIAYDASHSTAAQMLPNFRECHRKEVRVVIRTVDLLALYQRPDYGINRHQMLAKT